MTTTTDTTTARPEIDKLLGLLRQPTSAQLFGRLAGAPTSEEIDRAWAAVRRLPADAPLPPAMPGHTTIERQLLALAQQARHRVAQLDGEIRGLQAQRDELAQLLTA